MTPRSRVQCSCKCGQEVTTEMESIHLTRKYYAKLNLVPKTARKRQPKTPASVTGSAPTQPISSHSPPGSPLLLSEAANAIPGPSSTGSRLANQERLWKQAFTTRVTVSDDEESDEEPDDESNGSGSEEDSDDDAQPLDEPGVPLNPATYGIPPGMLLREEMLVKAALDAPASLTPSQLDDIDAFDFIVQRRLTVATYFDMQKRFVFKRGHSDLPSLRQLRTRILALSGLKPVRYDCCKDVCVCFTGPFSNLDACPECKTPRKNSAGVPYNSFEFLPPIPQFWALFCDQETCKKMQYRHNYPENDELIADVFSAKRYKELQQTQVVIEGERQPFKFFEDPRELALGLSADGMCPFKKRKKSCWPLILVNYNLPPEERIHIDNIVCVGVIPGPKSPKNMSSFLWPLVEQLLELAAGVPAVDALTRELFLMRGHILNIFGDIPAISKMLEFLGHNAYYPCRFCLILAIWANTAGGGRHLYCPLHRDSAPFFDASQLPLRTHEDTLARGFEILHAPTAAARSRLATSCGIGGVTALARVPSVSVPLSFPIDFMHLVYLNLIPQLVDLWTGDFNNLTQGQENYSIEKALWKAIGETVEGSGSTMPSSFGCKVPNLALPGHGRANAEAWNMFGAFLAPCVLRRRFRNPKYYHHFVRLVKLLNKCTSFDMPRSEIPALREGFARWVQEFEKFYYQYNPDRMQVCTVNVHYLLHIADAFETNGPPSTYWSFLMERFCSLVGAVVKNRRDPYSNITRCIRDRMQLKILRHLYGSHESLQFLCSNQHDSDEEKGDIIPNYPRARLLEPCAAPLVVTTQLRNKISAYLGTTFGRDIGPQLSRHIPPSVKQWRQVRISQGGDKIDAASAQKRRIDSRDSSFVRYELLVDRVSHRGTALPRLERKSQYGQLEHIFTLPLRPHTPANPSSTTKLLLLALISEASTVSEKTHEYPVTYYEGSLQSGEVVDAQAIQCLVGRVQDRGRFWIIDRSADCELTFPEFV